MPVEKLEEAVQIDAKNPGKGSRCNCEDRSFKKKETWAIMGDVDCDSCGARNSDHYYVCQKDCGYKFCNTCMERLEYPK